MRLSENFFYTIRENSKDEDSVSGNLLVRSGMFKKIASGIYMKMPLGLKVYKNVENIIRRNMNDAGAIEVSMPLLLPIDVFETSGRKQIFGKSMFPVKDRYDREYALGPTHEEFFVLAAMMKMNSYKDMPKTLYQIGNKYRDEVRPRLGLIRIREFSMKDAYSFDTSDAELTKSYMKMFDAYHKIFTEVGLKYVVVKADTGAMGGSLSEEFQALTDTGEDTLVVCPKCEYSSNVEVCECVTNTYDKEELLPKEKIHTPNVKTIEELTNFLKLDSKKFVKTLIYKDDNNFYACLIPGNRELNEVKLAKLLGVPEVSLAEAHDVKRITNAEVGFAGPININISIVMDNDIMNMTNYIVGANETDYHYINVNNNDFESTYIGDIKLAMEGDHCPKCGELLTFTKGIEIGNTFKLGTKYSESFGLKYADRDNKLQPVVMGCYGIGLDRIIASIVEQNHDEKGIIWPMNIAPYKVAIVIVSMKDTKQVEFANKLYNELISLGIDTVIDDRDERVGVKFNDMDLIGVPLRITVGNKIETGEVELKLRLKSEMHLINKDKVIEEIKNIL